MTNNKKAPFFQGGLRAISLLMCVILLLSGCASGNIAPEEEMIPESLSEPVPSVPEKEISEAEEEEPDIGMCFGTGSRVSLWEMDHSLPPTSREWNEIIVPTEAKATANELLWLLRDPENGLQKAREAVMGDIVAAEEYNTLNIEIVDMEFVVTEQYLQNLCYTLCMKGSGGPLPLDWYTKFRVLQGGKPLEWIPTNFEGYYSYWHYTPEPQVGYYTALEIHELQKEIPYQPEGEEYDRYFGEYQVSQWYWENEEEKPSPEKLKELEILLNGWDDPVKHELTLFLQKALPGYHTLIDYSSIQFDGPENAPNEMLVLCGLMHRYLMVSYGAQEGDTVTPQGILNTINKHTIDIVYGWPAFHVEEAARRYYGDNITIVHQGYGNKRFGYGDFVGLYGHFPGGTGGDDCYFPVLSYENKGDTLEAEIALLYAFHGMGRSYVLSKKEGPEAYDWEEIPWEDVAEYAKARAPRALVTIDKNGGERFTVQGFSYLGTSGKVGEGD